MRRVSMISRAHLMGGFCIAVLSLLALSAQAGLISVLDGKAVYDEEFNITWVANANLADTEPFGLNVSGVEDIDTPNWIGSTGKMTWDNAHLWIAGMNAANYLGASDWRLPITVVPDVTCASSSAGGSNKDCTLSEMGHLFNTQGVSSANSGPFSHVQPNRYWSSTTHYWNGTEYLDDSTDAWTVRFTDGYQIRAPKASNYPAFAVRDGDIRSIPEPTTALLLAVGLAGLAAAGRRA